MRSQWTELPGDLACDQESMTLKRDGSSRKRRDDRNGKNARIQPHNPTQLTASLVPNATACLVRGLASSVISAPTPHSSEVMVISEDGGRTSSSSLFFVGTYSNISDDHLDNLVRQAQSKHNGIGSRLLMGYVQSQG